MKKIFIISVLILLLVMSKVFAGGPDNPRPRRERRGVTSEENITKEITLNPEWIKIRRNAVIMRENTGRRTAYFYTYRFSKDNFDAMFPNGLKKITRVKVHIFKSRTVTSIPNNPDNQPMQVPHGGFKYITYSAKILQVLQ